MEPTFTNLVLLPIGLGLIGFIEPCSIGSTLIFLKHIEGREATARLVQVGLFAGTRAVLIGFLGLLAVLLGGSFLGLQRGAWVALGSLYIVLGVLYATGKAGALMVTLGPGLSRLTTWRGSAALGVLFGLNIPACAAPLLFALLGAAAAGGASGSTLAGGFLSLSLFGLALSLPLIVAVMFERARSALDRLAALSYKVPFWTGVILIALGGWSIWLAAFAKLPPPP